MFRDTISDRRLEAVRPAKAFCRATPIIFRLRVYG
jgi:hypothetical protein